LPRAIQAPLMPVSYVSHWHKICRALQWVLAVALEPRVQGYVIAGRRSEEPGHAILLGFLRLKPVLTLEMRLGEGSGAVLAMPVIESAIALYAEMATFASAGVSEAKE
jgi:nicotinate-nucleotide--dimethylbenzimidazole phosphoribosyltransferase